jgi:hypothetical protein
MRDGCSVAGRRWLYITILSTLMLLIALPVNAQGTIRVIENVHEHEFEGPMTFRLEASSDQEINSVTLFYRVSGQTAAHRVEPEFEPGTTVQAEHTEDMDDPENHQPPMITFTYWWTIEDKAGNRLKTDPISFAYEDTRYNWQVLENDRVRLYWHDQSQAFGERYFDAATQAANELSEQFGVTVKDPVAIVIYNTHEELMSVLTEASSEWTGAVNFGRAGVIAIGLGSSAWMEAVIPHELTHAMLYLVTKPPFGDIPRWLHEGLAVRSEGGMSSEERAALDRAIREDNLLSLRVLNSPFADQRERAILSYAESSSLVEFIVDEYGTAKLGELIAVFAAGAHYDDAMQEVFGVDMDGMEDLWRTYVGAQPRSGSTRATPAASATLVPSPSSTFPPTATEVPTLTSTSVPEPSTTPTQIAALPTATQTPPPQEPPASTSTPSPASPRLCLSALPAALILGLFLALRRR